MPGTTFFERSSDVGAKVGSKWHGKLRRAGVILLFGCLLLISAWTFWHYGQDREEVRTQISAELAAIADLKKGEIEGWRSERLSDARFFGQASFVARDIQSLLKDPSATKPREEVLRWMALLKGDERYSLVTICDLEAKPLISLGEPWTPSPSFEADRQTALTSLEPVMGNLEIGRDGRSVSLRITTPVFGHSDDHSASHSAIALLVLELNPAHFLYPLVQRWPLPTKSGETVLLREDHRELIYLSDLRFRPNSAMRLRFREDDPALPGVLAKRNTPGPIEATDYRGVPVLAIVRKIRDSDWIMVSKVDQEEIYAPLKRSAVFAGQAAFFLSLAAVGGLARYWHQRELRLIHQGLEAERARSESDSRFSALIDSAMDAIVSVDEENRIVLFNPAAEAMFGYRQDEMLGQPLDRLVPRDLQEAHTTHMRGFMSNGATRRRFGSLGDVRGVRKNGEQFPIEVSISKLKAGGRVFSSAIVRDITERLRAEAQITHERQLLKTLIQTIPDMVWLKDLDGVYLACNPKFEAMYGVSEAEIVGRRDSDFVSTEVAAQFRANDEAAIQLRRPRVNIEEVTFARDGHREWVETVKTPMYDGNGQIVGVLGIARDVTESRRSQQRLAASEAALSQRERQLRLFIEHAPVAIAMFDTEMRYLVVSRRWANDFHLQDEELTGRSHYEDFPGLPDRWKAVHRRCLAGAVERCDEDCWVHDDGREQWLRWEVRPWYTSGEIIGGLIFFSEDITIRKRQQLALRASEERFRELAANVTQVFWIADPRTGEIQYINPAYETIWGLSVDEAYTAAVVWPPSVHADDQARLGMANRPEWLRAGFDVDYRIARPDGEEQWIHDRGFPVVDAAGKVSRIVGVAEDITESRSLESQLRQAQKMEAIGQLAGGVAHDFNNILSVITVHSDLLMMMIPEEDASRGSVQEILQAAERAASLTRQLLVFSRQQVVEPRTLDLNSVVSDSEKMLRRLIGEDVTLTTTLQPDLRPVRIDPGHIVQVIMNLCVNARDAMPMGGSLRVETNQHRLEADYCSTHPEVTGGEYVVLAISDTGCGMPPEVLARIFEPFFTTKGVGHGTGLGLAVVHGIVKQAGGHLDVATVIGDGTTFRVYLPAADCEAVEENRTGEAGVVGGNEVILLVEDEEPVRKLTTRALEHLGYRVLTATDGQSALRIAQEAGSSIDLLVTDVVMPGMNGREVAEALTHLYPHLRVLYQSGYTDDAVVRHGVQQAEVAFLQKPFTLRTLATKLRAVLDSRDM